jgi:cytochrome b involved in lipid metabolism
MGGGISSPQKSIIDIKQSHECLVPTPSSSHHSSPHSPQRPLISASAAAMETIRISIDEVLRHDSITNSWTIYNGYVYDLTEFIQIHPGGANSIAKISGKDCTKIFHQIHPKKDFHEFLSGKCLGYCEDFTQNPLPPPPSSDPSSSTPSSPTRCDSPTTSWRKYCERISKRTMQSLEHPRP